MTDDLTPDDFDAIAAQVKAWTDHTADRLDLVSDEAPPLPLAPAATGSGHRRMALAAAAAVAVIALSVAMIARGGDDGGSPDERVASDPGVATTIDGSHRRPATSTDETADSTTTTDSNPTTSTPPTEPPGTGLPPVTVPPASMPSTPPATTVPPASMPSAPPQTTAPPSTQPPQLSGGPVSGTLRLPTTTVAAGGSIEGTIDISNTNGRRLGYTYCGSAFATGLSNATASQSVNSPACASPGVLETGVTAFPIKITTTYGACTTSTPGSGIPACNPDGSIPNLPPATYNLQVYGPGGLDLTVSTPSITITA